jgi:adenosine deaminase
LKTNDIEVIRKTPKTDRHCHSALSMSFNAFEKWANKSIEYPPVRFSSGLPGMIQYVNTVISPNVQTYEHVIELICLSLDDAITDGVTYAEFSLELGLIPRFPSIQDFLAAIEKVAHSYQKQICFRPELGINKAFPPEEVFKLAEPCIESGIFKSIDLYGAEDENSLIRFKDLYKKAERNKLIKKAHIGEFSSAESIKKAVEELELNEVQHGIRAVDSPEVLEFLKRNDLTLDICPASNLALGAVTGISEHPMRELYDYGIKITINTDDKLLFYKGISEQFMDLYLGGVFTAEELDDIRISGFDKSAMQFL